MKISIFLVATAIFGSAVAAPVLLQTRGLDQSTNPQSTNPPDLKSCQKSASCNPSQKKEGVRFTRDGSVKYFHQSWDEVEDGSGTQSVEHYTSPLPNEYLKKTFPRVRPPPFPQGLPAPNAFMDQKGRK